MTTPDPVPQLSLNILANNLPPQHVSPGYVITTLHIFPESTSPGMEGLSTWAKSLVTASNTFICNRYREQRGFFHFLSKAKLSDTWQSCILLLVINSSPQVATIDLK